MSHATSSASLFNYARLGLSVMLPLQQNAHNKIRECDTYNRSYIISHYLLILLITKIDKNINTSYLTKLFFFSK